MDQFLDAAANQNHPLRILSDFLKTEESVETAKRYNESRFVGYVLEIGYDEITIITCDPFKVNVGGIPRNSLLIMVPDSFEQNGKSIPLHFTLLRVLDSAPTPLSKEVQQTYFELQKKSMPELDIFTQSELQWGALKTKVLGMFYPHPTQLDTIEFSGDLNNYVSAHKYKIYSPDDKLLDLVSNELVPKENRFAIGKLRLTENRLPLPGKKLPDVDIFLSTNDFKGCRTAMFGKTRLGKSNVVKLIVQSLLETTRDTRNVGQLIFDINGEYANDNPQDDNLSIRGAYPDRCTVYALTPKTNTPSQPLKLNFYHTPFSSKQVLNTLIRQSGRSGSDYVDAFISVDIPDFSEVNAIPNNRMNEKIRAIRKIQYYFALLHKCQFACDENTVRNSIPSANSVRGFNPGFSDALRNAAYSAFQLQVPQAPNSLDTLQRELEVIHRFKKANPADPNLRSGSGNPIFDQEDNALLEMLEPNPGRSGFSILLRFRSYHDHRAGDYTANILHLLDEGQTVILDLGNADEILMTYFSRQLSEAVFYHQTDKFTNNQLGNHFIQLYFEEAHNLFGYNDNSDETRIYRRFAKEGAKYHIGMVYSTQSPSTINSDLLAQTENFFVAHLASQEDVNKLAKVNIAYESIKNDILQAKTPGYMRMLTRSHRFVVSMQAKKFTPPSNTNK
ncbi:ATP-binding protein [Tenuifilum osseticum]|uniref:ATP-binding protein n=1 Tax=Tenuifilum osseticum TaxID=3374723 RepID=UPI0034E53AE4